MKVSVKTGEVTAVRLDSRQSGSLVVLSDRPVASRIRMVGTVEWRRQNEKDRRRIVSDETRYDLLPPGQYEIAILPSPFLESNGAAVVGKVTVAREAETRFHVGVGR